MHYIMRGTNFGRFLILRLEGRPPSFLAIQSLQQTSPVEVELKENSPYLC